MRVVQRLPKTADRRPVSAFPSSGFTIPLLEVLSRREEWMGEPLVQYRFRAGEDVVLAPYFADRQRGRGLGLLLFSDGFAPVKPDGRFTVFRDGELEAGVDVYRVSRLPCPDLSCLHAIAYFVKEDGEGFMLTPLCVYSRTGDWSHARREEIVNGVLDGLDGVTEEQPWPTVVSRRLERLLRRWGAIAHMDRLASPTEEGRNAGAILTARAGEEYFLLPFIREPVTQKTIVGIVLYTVSGYGWQNTLKYLLDVAPLHKITSLFLPFSGYFVAAPAPKEDYAVFLGDCRSWRLRELERSISEETFRRCGDPYYHASVLFSCR